MSEKRYVVPEGMVQAGATGWLAARGEDGKLNPMDVSRSVLIEALRWWSENPMVPTDQQLQEMRQAIPRNGLTYDSWVAVEWQRRCFLAPEPEVTEAVKDLLLEKSAWISDILVNTVNRDLLEAYRRGQKSVKDVADPLDRGVK